LATLEVEKSHTIFQKEIEREREREREKPMSNWKDGTDGKKQRNQEKPEKRNQPKKHINL